MKKTKLLLSIAIVFICTSCNNSKKSNADKQANSIQELQTNAEKYRLIVSFYSKGEGKDRKNHPKFKEFLEKNHASIAHEEFPWGREGEIDYCFKLNELSTIEQQKFIDTIKELLASSTLVHVLENADCVHKR